MHGLCIRSTWIVSPTSRPWLGFRTILNYRPTSGHNPCPYRSLSSTTTRISRPTHLPPREHLATPKVVYEYTAAQVTRAASQAIRMAIRQGNIRSAYYVVWSMLQSSSDTRIKPPPLSHTLPNAMNFGRPLPSRLAAHSLIHSLLQKGLILEAGREIQKMIALGIRFHTRTLEANVRLLCSQPSCVPEDKDLVEEQAANPSTSWEQSETSHTLMSQSTRLAPEAHLALNILSTARRSRHGRTERMYDWLVDACLLQGEIVVATLLFVLLVKDWQLRRIVRSSPTKQEEAAERDLAKSVGSTQDCLFDRSIRSLVHAGQLGLDDPCLMVPYPDKGILQKILNSINHHIFSRDTSVSKSGSIESLSILANLLQQRSLPFGQISPLLRTLQNCPASPPYTTGALRNGRYIEVNVYDQVHEALSELCTRLPRSNPHPSVDRPDMLPRLDLRTYNSLIYYALRHRLSPSLANSVIEHMTVRRKPPLHPDTVTYNTLLRSASLLQRNDIASKVLEKLRQRQENCDHIISKIGTDVAPIKSSEGGRYKRQPMHERIQAEHISIPNFIDTPRRPLLRADLYTLSSYITHLVSIGRPGMVADIIFDLLPELHAIDHPASSPSAKQWTPEQRLQRRKECIIRAAEYGPFVFSALLNALSKAGKTGLAERVWLLARQAERASWMPRDTLDAAASVPWCLPIQAYTSIMQCYANESKKGLACGRGARFPIGMSTKNSSMHRRSTWVSTQVQQRKIYVKGWAYFFRRMESQEQSFLDTEQPLRLETSRTVGWLLFKAMRKGATSVWQELLRVQPDHVRQISPEWAARLQSLELPVPDARFFNVLLDIFGRRPNMQTRRVRVSPSRWSRKLRITRQLFANSGWLSLTYDRTLIEIAREMAQAGYALPLGLQRVLVGRVTFKVRRAWRYQVRPWAFPPRVKPMFQPFALPVTRTRGLPSGRPKAPHFRPWTRRRRSERRGQPVENV